MRWKVKGGNMNVIVRGEGVVKSGGLHLGGDCNDVECPSSEDGTTNQGLATACHAPQGTGGVVRAIKDVGPRDVITTTMSTTAGAVA